LSSTPTLKSISSRYGWPACQYDLLATNVACVPFVYSFRTYGPVPIGPLATSAASWTVSFGSTDANGVARMLRKVASAALRSNSTVVSSIFLIPDAAVALPAITSAAPTMLLKKALETGEADGLRFGSRTRLNDATTSSAVMSRRTEPSGFTNLTPVWILTV